jgi:hypothetical protein
MPPDTVKLRGRKDRAMQGEQVPRRRTPRRVDPAAEGEDERRFEQAAEPNIPVLGGEARDLRPLSGG